MYNDRRMTTQTGQSEKATASTATAAAARPGGSAVSRSSPMSTIAAPRIAAAAAIAARIRITQT